jgi:hypothetical protein
VKTRIDLIQCVNRGKGGLQSVFEIDDEDALSFQLMFGMYQKNVKKLDGKNIDGKIRIGVNL